MGGWVYLLERGDRSAGPQRAGVGVDVAGELVVANLWVGGWVGGWVGRKVGRYVGE